ncbi:MAG: hypothetical protein GC160_23115 [Acidobacteria bacterium]|nr:hypothetical protein [Acidobacteriota bacterium]
MRWVVKTSSVRVATGDSDRVYRSLDEIPGGLREQVRETIAGPRSQTILIANQEAYDQILRGVPDLPPEMRKFQPALLRQRGRVGSKGDRHWKMLLFGGFTAIFLLWALWIWSIRSGM